MSPRPAGNFALRAEHDITERNNAYRAGRNISPRAGSNASQKNELPHLSKSLSPYLSADTRLRGPLNTSFPNTPPSSTDQTQHRPSSALHRSIVTSSMPRGQELTPPLSADALLRSSTFTIPPRNRPTTAMTRRPDTTASLPMPIPDSSMSQRLATIASVYRPPSAMTRRPANTVSDYSKYDNTLAVSRRHVDTSSSISPEAVNALSPLPTISQSGKAARTVFLKRSNAVAPLPTGSCSTSIDDAQDNTHSEADTYLNKPPWSTSRSFPTISTTAPTRPPGKTSSGPASTSCPKTGKRFPMPGMQTPSEAGTSNAGSSTATSRSESDTNTSEDSPQGRSHKTILTIAPGPASTICPHSAKIGFPQPDAYWFTEVENDFPQSRPKPRALSMQADSSKPISIISPPGQISAFNVTIDKKDDTFADENRLNYNAAPRPERDASTLEGCQVIRSKTESKKGAFAGISALTLTLVLLALIADSWVTLKDTKTHELFAFGLWPRAGSGHPTCSDSDVNRTCCILAVYANFRTQIVIGFLIGGMLCDVVSLVLGITFYLSNLGKRHWIYSLPAIVTLLMGADFILVACVVLIWDLKTALRQVKFIGPCPYLYPTVQISVQMNWGFYMGIASACIYLLKAALFSLIVYYDRGSSQPLRIFHRRTEEPEY